MSIVHRADRPGLPWQVKWREAGRQRSRAFRTRREAVQFEAEVLRAQALAVTEIRVPVSMPLDDWIGEWFRVHGPTWAPSTLRGRAVYCDRWIAPYLGGYPIGAITRGDVSRWRAAILRDGASNDTVNHATRVLSACLGRAVDDGVLPGNPVLGLRALRHRVSRPRSLTGDECALVLASCLTDRDRKLVALMLHAGLRPGEAVAVEWGDFDGGVLHVTRSVRVDGSVSTPKSGRGRTIRVRPELSAYLNGGDNAGIVAPARLGGVLNYRGWYRNSWVPLRERTGIAASPYDLRHTFASRRIAEGASVVEVAQEMGHADPSLTLRRYAHLFATHSAPS